MNRILMDFNWRLFKKYTAKMDFVVLIFRKYFFFFFFWKFWFAVGNLHSRVDYDSTLSSLYSVPLSFIGGWESAKMLLLIFALVCTKKFWPSSYKFFLEIYILHKRDHFVGRMENECGILCQMYLHKIFHQMKPTGSYPLKSAKLVIFGKLLNTLGVGRRHCLEYASKH